MFPLTEGFGSPACHCPGEQLRAAVTGKEDSHPRQQAPRKLGPDGVWRSQGLGTETQPRVRSNACFCHAGGFLQELGLPDSLSIYIPTQKEKAGRLLTALQPAALWTDRETSPQRRLRGDLSRGGVPNHCASEHTSLELPHPSRQ